MLRIRIYLHGKQHALILGFADDAMRLAESLYSHPVFEWQVSEL